MKKNRSKNSSRVVLFFLALLTALLVSVCNVYAYDRWGAVAPEELEAYQSGLLRSAPVSPNAWQKIDGVCYNGSGEAIPGAITRGIDVSEWQGDIDWVKVKNSGIDFAFIRVAYGMNYLDQTYDQNMRDADAAGIPVGTYIYSTALTTEGALKEANLVIDKMRGYKVSYPVVFDLEYSRMEELSPNSVAQMAKVFCDTVRAAGYYPMVYCNAYWYSEKIDWSLLGGVDVWIARYGDTIPAPDASQYRYQIWQSTDGDGGGILNPTKGLVDGIALTNNVDVNFGFVDYTKIIKPRTQPLDTANKNGWAYENGHTYYYVNNQKVTGWRKIDGKYYFFHRTTGSLYRDRLFVSSDKTIRYVDETGAKVCRQWVDYNGKRYYIGANGCGVKGLYKISGKTYYFHPTSGYMLTGWQKIDGKYYFFNKTTGAMYTSKMFRSSSGKMCYVDETGAKVYGRWVEWSKKRYYITAKGYAAKGFYTIDGKCYYFHPDLGYLCTNQRVVSSAGSIFYVGEDGARLTNGMYTVTVNGNQVTYYFDKLGHAYKGWLKLDGKRYYFYGGTSLKAGTRAENTKLKSSGGYIYVFDKDGVYVKRYKA